MANLVRYAARSFKEGRRSLTMRLAFFRSINFITMTCPKTGDPGDEAVPAYNTKNYVLPTTVNGACRDLIALADENHNHFELLYYTDVRR